MITTLIPTACRDRNPDHGPKPYRDTNRDIVSRLQACCDPVLITLDAKPQPAKAFVL